MPSFTAMQKGYSNLWSKATVLKAQYSAATSVAKKIIANRERYEYVGNRIGQPQLWPLIGAIHNREASLSFKGAFHNGDPIIGTGKKTYHVPAGRGPFSKWEYSAVDALTMPGKTWNLIKDWPISRWLFQTEGYNGWGYFLYKHVNSPYLWAGTSLQQRGKYIADGVWSTTAWDTQLGVVAILKAVFEIDPSLEPDAEQKSTTAPVVVGTGGVVVASSVVASTFDPSMALGIGIASIILGGFWLSQQNINLKGNIMTDVKSWSKSKGVWGGIVAAAAAMVPLIANSLGYHVTGDDVNNTVSLGSQIVAALGGLWAIYGRIVATKPIS